MGAHRRFTSSRTTLVLLSLATAAALSACSDGTETPTAPDGASTPSAAVDRAGIQDAYERALAAQERHGARLLATPGVAGHGVGLVEGEPGVRVFLVRPDVAAIPGRLDDVPVETVVTGMFVAGSDPTMRQRPAPNGFSLGHPDITAGTLGAIVKDADGVCYALSNNHVLANSNAANIGDSALQPGPYDGGQDPADAIGTLAAFKAMTFDGSANDIDAAIAKLFSAADVTAQTPADAYGAPGSTPVAASYGLDVQKFGRTTGLTTGEVTETNVSVNVCYACAGPFCFRCSKLATFTGQIATTDMSDGGDSGSLIVTSDTNKYPVGLLFAGSTTRTLANPIGPVLTHFGVSIVTDPQQCGSTTPVNQAPTVTIAAPDDGASFEEGSEITFTASASDAEDGDLTSSIAWSSEPAGVSGSGGSVTATLAPGTYTVTASVTDGGGESGSDQVTITVIETGGSGIVLSATGYKVKGVQHADLSWSGATSTNVDVYRDGSNITTTANDGAWTDNLARKGGGSATYRVCEAGTTTCSNDVAVTF